MLNLTLGQPPASHEEVLDLTRFYWGIAICFLLYFALRRGDPEVRVVQPVLKSVSHSHSWKLYPPWASPRHSYPTLAPYASSGMQRP